MALLLSELAYAHMVLGECDKAVKVYINLSSQLCAVVSPQLSLSVHSLGTWMSRPRRSCTRQPIRLAPLLNSLSDVFMAHRTTRRSQE